MISISPKDNEEFVYIPSAMNKSYFEEILSRSLGKDVGIKKCTSTNLCSGKFGGVSNCGATVVRLSLILSNEQHLHIVAKVSPPCAVNIFKIDCKFDSRMAEIAWVKWWGEQNVSWVPIIYDTRANLHSRELWIIQEYFPHVGWPGLSVGKDFVPDISKLQDLMHQVALFHSYSRSKLEEIRATVPLDNNASINACSSQELLLRLNKITSDSSLLSMIGITAEEQALLDDFANVLGCIPEWVEEWDEVCAPADWSTDNFGFRENNDKEAVLFDFGTTRLAPMEEDLDVILMRMKDVSSGHKNRLLQHYLNVYMDKTGHSIGVDLFLARLPWARFFVNLRYLLGHVEALRWVQYQTRSREFIHLFIRLCGTYIKECRTKA